MEAKEIGLVASKQVRHALVLGGYVVRKMPLVGPSVQKFLDQDKRLDELLQREGEEHLEALGQELAVAEVCGPEEEANKLRGRIAKLAVEIYDQGDETIVPMAQETSE